jgi:hypothetical protein
VASARSRNIFGDEIGGAAEAPAAPAARQSAGGGARYQTAAAAPPAPPARPLSRSVEMQVDAPPSSSMHSQQLEDLYMAAEDLLKTGKDLEFVAARTKLPMEEIRMLSQLIIREQLEENGRIAEKPEDSRLGVLGGGGIKRQVQTL